MSNPYSRLSATRTWLKTITVLAMILGVFFVVLALVDDQRFQTALPYIIAGAIVFFMGALASGLAVLVFKIEANAHRIHELMIETKATQDKNHEMLTTIRDNSQISDAAKSITHRELERDALRKAIREDIVKESLPVDEVLRNAPKRIKDFFGVPKVIE